MPKNNQIRMQVNFEGVKLMDAKRCVRDEDDFDDMMDGLKLKLFGGRRRD